MRAAVFFDRDDTLIVNRGLPAPPLPAKVGDLVDSGLVRAIDGAVEACVRLREAGYVLVVVTNQGAVARGGLTLRGLDSVQARVRGVFVDGASACLFEAMYACPYHPVGEADGFVREHPWRKPGGGMISAAARDLGLDLGRSWMVGDAERDLEAAVRAGIDRARALRVGEGAAFASVVEAAAHVLSHGSSS